MDINFADIALHAANVVILFFILRALVYKPVHNFLKARSDAVAASIDEAKAKNAAADAAKAQYEDALSGAAADAQAKRREILDAASADASKIVAGAQAEAGQIRGKASQEAAAASAKAVSDARGEIGEFALKLASRILSREVSAADNQAIADRFFDEYGKTAGTSASTVSGKGGSE